MTGRGGGKVRDSDVNHSIKYPPCPSHLLQVPCDSPLGVGHLLANGDAQSLVGVTEVGADVQGAKQGGRRCPDLGDILRGGGSGDSIVYVGDVGVDTVYWEASGRFPPQGGLQADGTTTSEREGRWVGVPPLAEAMDYMELQEVESYVSHRQNTVTQFIATKQVMDLFLVAERRPGSRVANWW